MKKILFLQNGTVRHSVSRVDQRFEAKGFAVDHFWAYHGEFPENLEQYSGVFITGSPHGAYEDIPWIHTEHELLQKMLLLRMPMLGVCFGSQILGSALCGRDQVFQRSFCEVGFKPIQLFHPQAGDALIQGLGGQVKMFVWHNDEVKANHPDMVILGSTDLCPNQIWRYRDQPVWGIQGHPELTRDQAVHNFNHYRERFIKDGANPQQLITEADECQEAKNLIHNFINYCWTQ